LLASRERKAAVELAVDQEKAKKTYVCGLCAVMRALMSDLRGLMLT
jgi:hypothetical protein